MERYRDMHTKKDKVEYIAAWIIAAIIKAIIVFGVLLTPAILEWLVKLILGQA